MPLDLTHTCGESLSTGIWWAEVRQKLPATHKTVLFNETFPIQKANIICPSPHPDQETLSRIGNYLEGVISVIQFNVSFCK